MKKTNVTTSLSRGLILDKSKFILLYLVVVICCCLVATSVMLMVFIPQAEWNAQSVALVILLGVGSVVMMSPFVFLIVKNKRIIKDVNLWLEDAVQLAAYSKKIGEVRSGVLHSLSIRIEVRFQYDGKVHKKQSDAKVCGLPRGYVGWYNQYADREIIILYSPKYDEVMILRSDDEINV